MSITSITLHRGRKQPARRPLQTSKPRLERLEDRLALSGFGPDDGAYIIESRIGYYDAVQVQAADQKIVAAGQTSAGTPSVERYDSQGNIDSSYGTGGIAAINIPAGYRDGTNGLGLTLQPDGKAVVAGRVTNTANATSDIRVARLTASGTLDTTFGSGGQTVVSTYPATYPYLENLTAAALQSSGKIVVAGDSGGFGLVGRFTASGALDTGKTGFGDVTKGKAIGYHRANELYYQPNPDGSAFNAEVVQPDDKLITAGARWMNANGTFSHSLIVARYTASGAIDTTFNGSGHAELQPAGTVNAEAAAVALQADGKIVVVGFDDRTDTGRAEPLVARFNANGTLDSTFGGGTGYIHPTMGDGTGLDAVVIQPDQHIVLGGGTGGGYLAARLDADGTFDTTFGGVGYKVASLPAGYSVGSGSAGNKIALLADGSIIVAGQVTNIDPSTGRVAGHPALARFYGDNAPAGTSASSATTAGSTTSTADATDAALIYLLTDPSLPGAKRKG